MVLPSFVAERISDFFDSEDISVDSSDITEAIQDTMYYIPKIIREVRAVANTESVSNKVVYWRGNDFRSKLGSAIRLDCAAMQEAVSVLWDKYCPDYPPLPFFDRLIVKNK